MRTDDLTDYQIEALRGNATSKSLKEMTFSELLINFLNMRDLGPDNEGGTDKEWYNFIEGAQREMDRRLPLTQGD